MLREWQKAVGVLEETKEGPNGRRIVTRRVLPSELRKKKTKADERFVLPAN
jgi:hypothetical protein